MTPTTRDALAGLFNATKCLREFGVMSDEEHAAALEAVERAEAALAAPPLEVVIERLGAAQEYGHNTYIMKLGNTTMTLTEDMRGAAEMVASKLGARVVRK